jgi:hypothetical protein
MTGGMRRGRGAMGAPLRRAHIATPVQFPSPPLGAERVRVRWGTYLAAVLPGRQLILSAADCPQPN